MHTTLFVFFISIAAGASGSTTKQFPCPDHTNKCVGNWFASKYGCIAVKSVDTSFGNFAAAELALHAPAFSLSYYRSDWTITGLDKGVIENFFIEDGKAVLTLFWDELSFAGTEFLTIHRKGELDVGITTPFLKYMKNVYTTTIISDEDVMTNIHLDSISFSLDDFPALVEVAAENEFVSEVLADIGANIPLLALEEGFYMGPVFANAYIHNAICALHTQRS